ncbi:CAZyme family AA3 [Penicillium roqueforti]|uniref:Long-chain-alcohol oxidase n=1 Tax=Penicillium roqueforti (strain FM164) TaxID=1365484 RepID=W6QPY1_PENRF|nr:CAZyme family AA3 [Penicillium roqueforti]CDM31622.1 Alcohol dehydrogenase, long-chain fatty [Penicillium roqueforti FM164]KAI3098064.1 CAZyme family AA3 [Penicillium roqueforti]KAI3154354.1 CAZyme family AA3 [Penicillium roqueforti]KAI3156167.1 CAZyme family AA3 [Penicillium roqueforti]
MPTLTVSTYTPRDVPLPPAPSATYFSELQWKTFYALADAVVPSIHTAATTKSSNDRVISNAEWNSAVSSLSTAISGPDAVNLATQYLQENVSSNPQFRAAVERLLGDYVNDEGRNGFGFIMSALNTRAGSLVMTGSTTPIQDQPIEFREKILRGWDTSRLAPLRAIYRGLTAIVKKCWVISSPTISPVLGFPSIPIHGEQVDGFQFEFLQFPSGDQPETIETDVVIVGSGCGGSVAAKNLAEAGYRVLVVEKSYSYPTNTFPMGANEGYTNMFENGGAVSSDDGSMAVLAGSTWGGGGTVNWSAALQTQGYVRQQWADTGLPFFTSLDFQKSLDRVCDRMGVNDDHVEHNYQNKVVIEGARKLGYAVKTVPQNTGHGEHYCGYCTLGCASGGKKGPTESFLVDAAQAGAKFIEGFRADKVLFTTVKGKKVASGVQGTWKSRDSYLGLAGIGAVERRLIIKAKKVVVSAGTLQSPLLLLRSGLKNPQIGRNLHLHPVLAASAVFDEDTHPWEGSALTTVVTEFEDLDGNGHGAKIETAAMLPSVVIPIFPWRDSLEYKMWAAKMRHSTSFIVLTKERDTGRVYPDPVDGRCRIDYTVSAFDRKHMVETLIGIAKIAYISGAKEFHTVYRDLPPFIRPETSDPEAPEGINNTALQSWIAELRAKSPLNPERGLFASAHQMGTCRMSKSPKLGVVDPDCQVWGTDGLYVVDASVFPSASGVNPMVTNMGIADWASRNLARAMGTVPGEGNVMARL